MKITKTQLKQIIKEEVEELLNEEGLQEKWWHGPALALGLGAGVAGTAAGVGAGIGAAKDAYETHQQDRVDAKDARLADLDQMITDDHNEIERLKDQLKNPELKLSPTEIQSIQQEIETVRKHQHAAERAYAGRYSLK